MVGIKPFGFFLVVNALQVEVTNAAYGLGVALPRDPAERLSAAAIGEDYARIFSGDAGDQ